MTRPIVICCLLGGLVAGFAAPASALTSIGAISREAGTAAQTVDYRCWWEYGRRHCRFVGDRDDWHYRDRDWRRIDMKGTIVTAIVGTGGIGGTMTATNMPNN